MLRAADTPPAFMRHAAVAILRAGLTAVYAICAAVERQQSLLRRAAAAMMALAPDAAIIWRVAAKAPVDVLLFFDTLRRILRHDAIYLYA